MDKVCGYLVVRPVLVAREMSGAVGLEDSGHEWTGPAFARDTADAFFGCAGADGTICPEPAGDSVDDALGYQGVALLLARVVRVLGRFAVADRASRVGSNMVTYAPHLGESTTPPLVPLHSDFDRL